MPASVPLTDAQHLIWRDAERREGLRTRGNKSQSGEIGWGGYQDDQKLETSQRERERKGRNATKWPGFASQVVGGSVR